MRALVQRVTRASVTVDQVEVGAIGRGLCVLVGVTHDDDETAARKLADKIWGLRVFDDADGRMNLSLADPVAGSGDGAGEVLVVSQFTLYADTRKGRRPSYVDAAGPEKAEALIELLVDELASLGAKVATGRFRAHMAVELVNDGPVTILLET
ncbi:MAG: D-aminoacyl-tRNA deacylase [Acidimicrobiales bacterium]